jgi:hypothetical protein
MNSKPIKISGPDHSITITPTKGFFDSKLEPFLEPRASSTWNRKRVNAEKFQLNQWSG